ncbi:hypothetical protein [Streptomyces albidoflavus]|uniref:hypothetical protein n=1 Tax=Streptomyces albidoflavus TaxID=1886 RepID=UPI0013E32A80|nr:hypothetical protein [Streptomyces albidoflavus]
MPLATRPAVVLQPRLHGADHRLDFLDAELDFDADSPVLTARLRIPAAPRLEGRWLADKGLLVTAIAG